MVCTKAQMSLITGEGNQLPTPQSAFHHWPTVLPLFTEWAKYFLSSSCSMKPHQSCLHLSNLFHWKHSCPFCGTGLFFLITGLPPLCILLQEIRFKSSCGGCLPTSPSTYPTSHLSCSAGPDPGLQHHRWGFPGATLWITLNNDCLVKKRLQHYNKEFWITLGSYFSVLLSHPGLRFRCLILSPFITLLGISKALHGAWLRPATGQSSTNSFSSFTVQLETLQGQRDFYELIIRY